MRLLVLFFLHSFSLLGNHKYYLSICAIFHNEDRFLKEWIEYHRLVGVEHFYLFNHLSTDSYLDVLTPYIEKGIVELFDWPYPTQNHKNWVKVQCGAYNFLVDLRKEETFWLAIIDTDEFIVPVKPENLQNFLTKYEKYAGLGINWVHFGSSHVTRIPENKTLIGTLTKRAPLYIEKNHFVKSIVQPKKIKLVNKPHHCLYKKGYFHVTENKEPFRRNKSFTNVISVNKIRIHHYPHRDEEFFYNEKRRRFKEWFPNAPHKEMETNYNDIKDPLMLRYVPVLEKRLAS